jgi:hypothetical protein
VKGAIAPMLFPIIVNSWIPFWEYSLVFFGQGSVEFVQFLMPCGGGVIALVRFDDLPVFNRKRKPI